MSKFDQYLAEESKLVSIGGGLKVPEDTKCKKCGSGVDKLKYYKGMLGFEAMECKKCGHQEDLNKE